MENRNNVIMRVWKDLKALVKNEAFKQDLKKKIFFKPWNTLLLINPDNIKKPEDTDVKKFQENMQESRKNTEKKKFNERLKELLNKNIKKKNYHEISIEFVDIILLFNPAHLQELICFTQKIIDKEGLSLIEFINANVYKLLENNDPLAQSLWNKIIETSTILISSNCPQVAESVFLKTLKPLNKSFKETNCSATFEQYLLVECLLVIYLKIANYSLNWSNVPMTLITFLLPKTQELQELFNITITEENIKETQEYIFHLLDNRNQHFLEELNEIDKRINFFFKNDIGIIFQQINTLLKKNDPIAINLWNNLVRNLILLKKNNCSQIAQRKNNLQQVILDSISLEDLEEEKNFSNKDNGCKTCFEETQMLEKVIKLYAIIAHYLRM